jgi:hypothetical protein
MSGVSLFAVPIDRVGEPVGTVRTVHAFLEEGPSHGPGASGRCGVDTLT